MSYIIAVAGKGGTGKTTISALIVRLLKEKKLGSILAVDADPNSNLGEVLGVETTETIGNILDQVAQNPDKVPGGMTKDRFIEHQVQTIIHESEGFDLLTMGKPEGPGCYCYVNNVLRAVLERVISNYKFVVIDNEAGLEHLSRRTTRKADCLLLVSEPTVVSLKAAKRISELVEALDIKVSKKLLVINSYDNQLEESYLKEIKAQYIGNVSIDKAISNLSVKGKSIWKLDSNSKAYQEVEKLIDILK